MTEHLLNKYDNNIWKSYFVIIWKRLINYPFFPFLISVLKVIKMLVAVVVIYVLCWGPMLVDNVLQAYGISSHIRIGWLKYMGTIFHLMAYFNRLIIPSFHPLCLCLCFCFRLLLNVTFILKFSVASIQSFTDLCRKIFGKVL